MVTLLRYFFRAVAVALAILTVVPDALAAPEPASASAKKKSSKKRKSKKRKVSGKRRSKKKSYYKKRRRISRKSSYGRRTRRRPSVVTLWMSPDSTSWIHRGAKGIIVYRDSTGVTRAMQPCTTAPGAGRGYADVISRYARALQPDSVRVYMLMAPSQGEYYMPAGYGTPGAEQRCIEATASYLDPIVTPVMVADTMRRHLDEEIYNRTDHHWAPLGAYYASGALAEAAGVGFLPLSEYTPRVVRDYVGTMYKFSGDPQVKSSPEDFVYYLPKDGYRSEFITYSLRGGKTAGETAPHAESFFKTFPDGSGAAYLTFMGGDTRTVKVTSTGGTPGRKLLIVKDSFGNAMASNLFGSFEEVHVVDFRFFPHNLADYARRNGITDMVFVNCVSIALNPNTAARLQSMLTHRDGRTFAEPDEILVSQPDEAAGDVDDDESAEAEDGNEPEGESDSDEDEEAEVEEDNDDTSEK